MGNDLLGIKQLTDTIGNYTLGFMIPLWILAITYVLKTLSDANYRSRTR
jgi:hypothetical protein